MDKKSKTTKNSRPQSKPNAEKSTSSKSKSKPKAKKSTPSNAKGETKQPIKDPHAKREAETYDNPVPSREFILEQLDTIGKSLSLQQFIELFELVDDEERQIGLRRRLRAMVRDGQIMANRRNRFGLVTQMDLIRGKVSGHKDGFGFLIPDDSSEDIYLSPYEMQKIMSGDEVLVRVDDFGRRGRKEGNIVEILSRNTTTLVGKYFTEKGVSYVSPDSKSLPQDILIPTGESGDAKDGDYVAAEIIQYPDRRRQATGRVTEILGNVLTPGMEVQLAIRSHDLPYVWPTEVEREVEKYSESVDEKDKKDREDLRDLPFVTIDGEDARDFDDAVYAEKTDSGWTLFVAIADVTHYLQHNSALDKCAYERGNSVYFPSNVIPMLPEVLSNGLCSLKPEQDRLAMVCEMEINHDGELEEYQFYDAVIHSHARLTYTQVAEFVDDKKPIQDNVDEHINTLYQLYQKLIVQREIRGAIDFETTETGIVFDDDGRIDKIVVRERNIAHRMIEESMLIANVAAADLLHHNEVPFLFRVHQRPEEAKLTALRDYMKLFGLSLGGGNSPSAKDYSKLLTKIRKRKDHHVLQMVMLRSLRQAVYSPENHGHFGLGYTEYTHFTSPIRRYPDVITHRGIKSLLNKKDNPKYPYTEKDMLELGLQFSKTERRADLATRDATDWLKCDYMKHHVGQTFSGIIVEVKNFGIFVKLDEIYVDGMVHISALNNDYYHYDPMAHTLTGKRSGVKYSLGDSVKVLVARVDLDERKIDFELAQ